jgi:hypothetical protein
MFDLATKLSDNRIRIVYTSAPQAAACILKRCPKAGVFYSIPDGGSAFKDYLLIDVRFSR